MAAEPAGRHASYDDVLQAADNVVAEGDILVPDLTGWLRSRLPAVPATPFLELPPDSTASYQP